MHLSPERSARGQQSSESRAGAPRVVTAGQTGEPGYGIGSSSSGRVAPAKRSRCGDPSISPRRPRIMRLRLPRSGWFAGSVSSLSIRSFRTTVFQLTV